MRLTMRTSIVALLSFSASHNVLAKEPTTPSLSSSKVVLGSDAAYSITDVTGVGPGSIELHSISPQGMGIDLHNGTIFTFSGLHTEDMQGVIELWVRLSPTHLNDQKPISYVWHAAGNMLTASWPDVSSANLDWMFSTQTGQVGLALEGYAVGVWSNGSTIRTIVKQKRPSTLLGGLDVLNPHLYLVFTDEHGIRRRVDLDHNGMSTAPATSLTRQPSLPDTVALPPRIATVNQSNECSDTVTPSSSRLTPSFLDPQLRSATGRGILPLRI